jgi:hypothetical protein
MNYLESRQNLQTFHDVLFNRHSQWRFKNGDVVPVSGRHEFVVFLESMIRRKTEDDNRVLLRSASLRFDSDAAWNWS